MTIKDQQIHDEKDGLRVGAALTAAAALTLTAADTLEEATAFATDAPTSEDLQGQANDLRLLGNLFRETGEGCVVQWLRDRS